MGSVRRLTIALAAVLVAALIAGAGLYVGLSQAAAANGLREDFAKRASMAADLTSSTLAASDDQNRQFAQEYLAGPSASLQTALDEQSTATELALVFAPDGHVLAARPTPVADDVAQDLIGDTGVRAVRSGSIAFGDLVAGQRGLMMTVAFPTGEGTRIYAQVLPLDVLKRFTDGYLSDILNVPGGHAVVIDGHQNVIASTGADPVGQPPRDRALSTSLASEPTASVDGNYYASASVPDTPWRVVFSAPDDAVLDPLGSTRQVSWQLFGAFVAAVLGIVALVGTALRRSARLAHARLHDALTGLPNRTLWMERAQNALDKHDDGVAVLFLDLDGFKAVNDSHGHGVGDALLAEVADRLRAVARRTDVIGRFGGDEFLVLCADLAEPSNAIDLAHRIRATLAAPMRIEGRHLSIGVSIGIAARDGEATNADVLVHRADVAMYRAKQIKDGVAYFVADMAVPAGERRSR
jgi:diguanylate cyclase (GGDEF)-like protein